MTKEELSLAQTVQIQKIFDVYKTAIARMRAQNIEQWDEIYPALCDIERDVAQKEMYVLQCDGRILSAVTINKEQDPAYIGGHWRYREGSAAVIHRLCVHPDTQGCGVGKRTMQQAEETARQKGFTAIRLDAFVHNPASNALYRSLGYESAGEIQLRKGRFLLYEKQLKD